MSEDDKEFGSQKPEKKRPKLAMPPSIDNRILAQDMVSVVPEPPPEEDTEDENPEEDALPEKEDSQTAEDQALASRAVPPFMPSKEEQDAPKKPYLWIVTFTDTMALMLTFFVLLYSMSTPDEKKWEDMTRGISVGISKFAGAEKFSGTEDTISIDKLSVKKGLNIKYLTSVVYETVAKNEDMKDVAIYPSASHLTVSLPSDLLFEPGQNEVSLSGKRALFALGELITRIRNRVEIVGHVGPDGGQGAQSHREASLLRAARVAAMLQEVGYDRPIAARGLSDSRHRELPVSLGAERRQELSRRVDLIIKKDEGNFKGVFQ